VPHAPAVIMTTLSIYHHPHRFNRGKRLPDMQLRLILRPKACPLSLKEQKALRSEPPREPQRVSKIRTMEFTGRNARVQPLSLGSTLFANRFI
jgi:hypothetical protein